MQDEICVAIPSGRIQREVVRLLSDAGVELNFGQNGRSLVPFVRGAPSGVTFRVMGPFDAIELIRRGKVHGAFIGKDMLDEYGAGSELRLSLDLGLDRVRQCFAAPHGRADACAEALERRTPLSVATKYSLTVRDWATTRTHHLLQVTAVERAAETFAGFATDAIFDVVASGDTLACNGLREILQIGESTTRFVISRRVPDGSWLDDLAFMLEGVLRARTRVLLRMNVANESIAAVNEVLAPNALESVDMTAKSGRLVTMSIACLKERQFEVIAAARKAGATAILAMPIGWMST